MMLQKKSIYNKNYKKLTLFKDAAIISIKIKCFRLSLRVVEGVLFSGTDGHVPCRTHRHRGCFQRVGRLAGR